MKNHMPLNSSQKHVSAGFSLVELMVALVIGIAASIIIMQMFSLSESRKRTSTGGADAQTNAAVGLYLMERDIRQAGYGLAPNTQDFVPIYTPPPTGVLTTGILAQCANVTGSFSYANSTFAPLVINPVGYPAGDSETDVILVNYSGSNGVVGKGVEASEYHASNSAPGFAVGDMVLMVPPVASPPADCTVNKLTAASTYSLGSRLYNLGAEGSFVSRAYAVRSGNLTMCTSSCTDSVANQWAPIASGVVAMQAQYGKDTNSDGVIDAWDKTQVTGASIAQIVAARLVLVARSSQYEKATDFTSTAAVWHKDAAGTNNAELDLSASSGDWARYRYKVAQSIVPLRNMIWGGQQ